MCSTSMQQKYVFAWILVISVNFELIARREAPKKHGVPLAWRGSYAMVSSIPVDTVRDLLTSAKATLKFLMN